MRVLLVFVVLSFVCVLGCSKRDAENPVDEAEVTEVKVDETLIYYTCPMESHKHIHSDKPGTCSECQMALVKGVVTSEEKREFYGCPMETHSHVRKDQSGTCAECGMALKPMRLDKSKTSA
jgi:hypothetical protein